MSKITQMYAPIQVSIYNDHLSVKVKDLPDEVHTAFLELWQGTEDIDLQVVELHGRNYYMLYSVNNDTKDLYAMLYAMTEDFDVVLV